MMAETKQYRRKNDGHVTPPLTEAEAKKMAGFDEGEFEVYDPHAAAKKAVRATSKGDTPKE